MSEYEAVGSVVVALGIIIGLFFTVSKPVVNLTSQVTKLSTLLEIAMKGIEENTNDQKEYEKTNLQSHQRLHNRIDSTEKDLHNFKRDVERDFMRKKE
ncbi:MAG: hypothetical protein R3Y58_01905 [Eubacteriales bacterium]